MLNRFCTYFMCYKEVPISIKIENNNSFDLHNQLNDVSIQMPRIQKPMNNVAIYVSNFFNFRVQQ